MRGLFRWATMLGASVALLVLSPLGQAATTPRVLLFGPSVHGGTSSWEAKKARADGFAVQVASRAQWDSMTTAQFKQYRALIIGDNEDSGNNLDLQGAVINAVVWGHAITGNIILAGSDPSFHASVGVPGAKTYIAKAIAFAAKRPGRTGFYFAGDYYTGGSQHVEVLDGLAYNGFYWQSEDENNIHIDPATTPKVRGLTDTIMSGWGDTAHKAFTKWPKKSFHVWAVGVDATGNWTTSDNVTGWAQFLVSAR